MTQYPTTKLIKELYKKYLPIYNGKQNKGLFSYEKYFRFL